MNIYDFTVKNQEGKEVSLSDYRDKVILIVNTATGCGFTHQYQQLQQLYDEFKEKGFEILDFPCNQFGGQAPGSDEEIHLFCTEKFGTTFPQFSKVDVNGENAIPLFKYLVENTKFEGFGMSPIGAVMSGIAQKMDKDYRSNSNIKWNFTKFLINREGNIVARFEPTDMKNIKEKIMECI